MAEQSDIEPVPQTEVEAVPSGKNGRALSKLRRELTEDEFSSSAVQRLLLEQLYTAS